MQPNRIHEEEYLSLTAEELRHRARSGLLSFTLHTFPQYQVNWHHRVTCQIINKWIRGDIRHLMVLEPPRYGKSELTSRRLPALLHGMFPKEHIISTSYSSSLAHDMAKDVQRIMDSPMYGGLFPDTRIIEPGRKHATAVRKANEHTILDRDGKEWGGRYYADGIAGSFTGKGARFLLIDDPIKNIEEAESEVFREKIWKSFINDLMSRLMPGGQILLTQTCWHQDDLAGRIIKRMKEDPRAPQFTVLRLQAIKREENPIDPRNLGEPLWPERYPLEELLSREVLDPIGFNALYQQRPSARAGGFIKRTAWRRYAEVPKDIIRVRQYWDCAEEPGLSNDFSVCATIAETPTGYYWLNLWREKVAWPELEMAAKDLYHKYQGLTGGLIDKVKIEKKASGTQLLQQLERHTKIPVEQYPEKGKSMPNKRVRAAAALPTINAGNCYLPEGELTLTGSIAWVEDFIKEHEQFPFAEKDDQVDTTSMGLDDLRSDTNEIEIW